MSSLIEVQFQLSMVHSLVEPAKKGGGGRTVEAESFRDVFCSHLMEMKKTCLMAKLPKCYEGHVLNAHAAYLLEALKVTSTLVALHLDSTVGDTNTNVASCPVFVEELDHMFNEHGQNPPTLLRPHQNGGGGDRGVAAKGGLVAAVVVLSLVLVAAALGFAVIQFRLGPRLKATLSRVPYMHFVTNEQRAPPPPPSRPAQSLDQQRSRNDDRELQVQGGPQQPADVTT